MDAKLYSPQLLLLLLPLTAPEHEVIPLTTQIINSPQKNIKPSYFPAAEPE